MKTMKITGWLCVGIALLAAKTADAQVPAPATEKLYLNVNFGGQLASRSVASFASKTVYDEPATLTSSGDIAQSALFDVGVGYRVWGDVFVGIGVSRSSTTGDAAYTASVPDPAVYGRPKATTGTETGLGRTELAVNPNVAWVTALADKVDIAIGLGMAFINLKQELAADFTVPAGTQSVIPVLAEQKGTAKGIYANVDLIYSIRPKLGVGGFVRYAGGKVDLDTVKDHNAGGMQVGGGIRLRF